MRRGARYPPCTETLQVVFGHHKKSSDTIAAKDPQFSLCKFFTFSTCLEPRALAPKSQIDRCHRVVDEPSKFHPGHLDLKPPLDWSPELHRLEEAHQQRMIKPLECFKMEGLRLDLGL